MVKEDIKQTNKYPLNEYDIWMSASGAQGDHNTKPIFVGRSIGRNFQDACMRRFLIDEVKSRVTADAEDEYYDTKRWDYDPYTNTYWACSLGETEESVEWKHI